MTRMKMITWVAMNWEGRIVKEERTWNQINQRTKLR